MPKVPDTCTFSFTDVCAIIDSTTLTGLFEAAVSCGFDVNYCGSLNSLYNFRNYEVLPTSTPVITLIGADTITIAQNGTYTEFGATAFDMIDGDITASIVTTGTVNTSVVGTYYRYYNVTNSQSVPAVQVVRTIVVNAVAAAIVCLYGGAGYTCPPNYPAVILTAAGGYSESCLVSLGLATGGTSALSSVKFPNTAYNMTIYNNCSGGDYTGLCYVFDNSMSGCLLCNFNCVYWCNCTGCGVVNDKTRSLCIGLI